MTPKPELAAILQEIVKENREHNLLYNSYFRVPKNIPEFLDKYNSLKYFNSKTKAIIGVLIAIPRILLDLIINFLASVLLAKQYKYFKVKNCAPKTLFISHATNNNLSGTTDVYFANLPSIIGEQKCTILYLNHNKNRYRSNFIKLAEKQNCANSLLMPKFLHPTEFVKYLNHCLELIKVQVKLSQKHSRSDHFKTIILIHSIRWIFSRESYNNYLISHRVKQINVQIEIEMAFLTLEGHSYEEVVANLIKAKNWNAKIFFYQHSPITKAQKGVEYLLRDLTYSAIVLTTGPGYSRFLLQFSNRHSVFCIGSNKIVELEVNKFAKIQTFLVAPEGTVLASNQFIRYLIQISKNFRDYNFILRLHPNLKVSFSTVLLRIRISKVRNVQISSEPILNDLRRTQATLYRSSTVSLETLKIQNIPIFVDFSGDTELNVYSVIENDFPVLSGRNPQLRMVEALDFNNFNFSAIDELYLSFHLPKDLLDFMLN